MTTASLLLVAFNPYFSKKVNLFLQSKKLKPTFLGRNHFLVKANPRVFESEKIQPLLIRVQEMKTFNEEKKMREWIVKQCEDGKTYSLRGWSVDHPTITGRDLEVKNGMALEKKGVRMNPSQEGNIWFILGLGKKWGVSKNVLTLDEHLFPYMDAKFTEEKSVTRSGKKLRFLLTRFGVNPKGKTIADLGCGSGGWVETLVDKGAAHVFAIDKTKLDKKLQQNKRVTYIPKKAEEAPKLKEKLNILVCDINVNPEHARKILLSFARKNPGAREVILTQKIMGGKDLNSIPKLRQKIGKWKVKGLSNTWWARREYYVHLGM